MPEGKSVFREVLPKQGNRRAACAPQRSLRRARPAALGPPPPSPASAPRRSPRGQLSVEDVPTMVLCKPKLLPLKSVTLEKLEKMQRAAQETIRQQEVAQKEQQQQSEQ
ncbi:BBSome-interacting protein 1 isoform X1 [Chelonia mydas]|uniref:BBSome-interacting protein 1 isoform X1 n=1 Tax=Chelonia mydas TaxID=8469 RepID=UPI001CA9E0E0|nr:BBSome-interacting protein 1 isoform X1 [Chelonia mydas]